MEWEELYNSCGIIKEPDQLVEDDTLVGYLKSPLNRQETLRLIIEEAGLISKSTEDRLNDDDNWKPV